MPIFGAGTANRKMKSLLPKNEQMKSQMKNSSWNQTKGGMQRKDETQSQSRSLGRGGPSLSSSMATAATIGRGRKKQNSLVRNSMKNQWNQSRGSFGRMK